MEPSPLEIRTGTAVQRLGRRRQVAWLTLAACGPTFVATVGPMLSIAHPAEGWIVPVFWISLIGFLAGAGRLLTLRFDPALSARRSLRVPTHVTVHADEVTLIGPSGNHRCPLSDLAEGWLEPSPWGPTAVLRLRSGDLWSIEVADAEGGERLLRAVGVAADQQVWKTRLGNASQTLFGGGCLAAACSVILAVVLVVAPLVVAQGVSRALDGTAGWIDLWKPVAWVAGDLVGFFFLLRALTPPLLTIGADGVAIRGFGRRRRFVPYAEVERVERGARAVALTLTSGEAVSLVTGGEGALGGAIHDRIVAAMAARRAGDLAGVAEVLDRGERSPVAWRDHLRTIGRSAGGEGYRSRRVPPERLATVLEDVASPPERRVAAALALARVDDPSLRRRVEAAVSSCADEDLRAALEAAAADEIAEEELCAVGRRR